MNTTKSEFQQLIDRFSEQTPIVRWGLAFVAAIVLYLVWSGFIAPTAKAWGASAEAIQRDVDAVKERDRMAAEIRRMRDSITTLGPVAPPMHITDAQSHLEAAINAVKQEHRMVNDSFSMRSPGPLQRGMLHGLTAIGQPTQLTGDLRFDADPHEAIAIIAALEARPEIARINQTFIQRIGSRRVNVQLTIESWVLTTDSPRRGRV